MLARLLMGFLADLVFDVVRSGQRSYEAEIDRYLDDNGLVRQDEAEHLPTS
jgi:hypothetical protein